MIPTGREDSSVGKRLLSVSIPIAFRLMMTADGLYHREKPYCTSMIRPFQ